MIGHFATTHNWCKRKATFFTISKKNKCRSYFPRCWCSTCWYFVKPVAELFVRWVPDVAVCVSMNLLFKLFELSRWSWYLWWWNC